MLAALLAAGCSDAAGPKPAGSCIPGAAANTPLTLALGEVAVLADPQAMSCVAIAARAAPSTYLFIAANANPLPSQASYGVWSAYSVVGGLAAAPAPQPAAPALQNGHGTSPEPDRAFELRLHALARRNLRLSDARQYWQAQRTGPPAPFARSPAAATVAVGDSITFHVPDGNASNPCTGYFTVRAVVKSVGAHGIIVQDTAAPANGFAPTDFAAISTEFDSYIYATDTSYFGSPTDLDHNGRVYLLYTPRVNALTKRGSQSYITGFFFEGDLFPPSSCAQTNSGEIFYSMVPDPAGTFSDARSTPLVRQVIRGTMAHEFEHMIMTGARLQNPTASWESIWLDEALAHFAEEYVGRAEDGLGPFQKLTFSLVSANANDFNAFFRNTLFSLSSWLQRPDTASSIANTDRSLADGGAAWALLHYAADQYAGGNLPALTLRLVAGPDSGLGNLTSSTGVPLDSLLAGWMVASYADGLSIPGLGSRYTFRSWNFRDAVGALNGGLYPLLVTPLDASTSVTATAHSGSGNYFRLVNGPSTPAAVFRLLSTNGAVVGFAGARLYVLRTQ